MQLKRLALNPLLQWARREKRKPLLLQGARQTGKTWLMKELGRTAFEHTAYFDFAERPELATVFNETRNPEVILRGLRLLSDVPILPGKTLLVFDEIQLCDTAFGSLKYFAVSAPDYAVIASGSLLGVQVRRKNLFVPVGQIEIERVTPLSFSEFLLNLDPKLYNAVADAASLLPLPDYLLPELERRYREFLCVGGMPAAVALFADKSDIQTVDSVLSNILNLYRLDFSQYADATESMRIANVWNAVPSQLAKANSRFFFSQVTKGARGREYTPAVQWLQDAGLIMTVKRASLPQVPLTAYSEPDIFKVYATDVGLLRVLAQVPAATIMNPSPLFKEFKGAMTENYAAVSLRNQQPFEPFYWSSGGEAEVDFLLQTDQAVIPIEVKAGTNFAGKSLGVFRARFKPELALRFSMRNLTLNAGVLNIPLPLTDWAVKLVGLAQAESAAA